MQVKNGRSPAARRASRLVVVSGYATLDYVVQAQTPFGGTGTITAALGAANAWPRAGGAALFASTRVAAAGHRALALTWVGDDADGDHYMQACRQSGIDDAAIDRRLGAATPRCLLIYQPDGEHGCLLDIGHEQPPAATPEQLALLGLADHLCVAAGPAAATWDVLNACPPATPVSWIAKQDRRAYPAELCRHLAMRAEVVFCNAGERNFVNSALPAPPRAGQTIIETRGSDGVIVDDAAGRRTIPARAIAASDATGAGDTFAGEVIARLVAGETRIDAAVEQGMSAARALLASRLAL